MTPRLLIAAVLGGLTIFFWGFASHMLLPLGEMGMGQATNEEATLSALKETLPGPGIYMVPGLAGDKYDDPAAVAAYSAKALANPYAFIAYQPKGQDGMDMADELARELATNIVAALVIAFVLSMVGPGLGRRVAVAGAMGVFAWLAVSVPYWNWYRFPLEFTAAALVQTLVGALLAGLVIGVVSGKR